MFHHPIQVADDLVSLQLDTPSSSAYGFSVDHFKDTFLLAYGIPCTPCRSAAANILPPAEPDGEKAIFLHQHK
jgi:hypothetical protein